MRDLKTLETFYWVATLGGFRNAAEHLNTTQPAVSARIARLEQDLGVSLFSRLNRRSTLTPQGAVLLSYAEKLFEIRSEMLQAVSRTDSTLRGSFRLGVSETLVHTWMPDLLDRISTTYPQITLDISVDTTQEIHKQLLTFELDLGLVAAPLDHPQARSLKLCSYPFKLMAAPDFALPRNCSDSMLLGKHPVITYPKAALSSQNLLAQAQEHLGLNNVRLWGVSPVALIVDMVSSGRGIGALSPVSVRQELADAQLRILPTRLRLDDLRFYSTYLRGTNAYLKEAIRDLAHAAADAYDRSGEYASKEQVSEPAD